MAGAGGGCWRAAVRWLLLAMLALASWAPAAAQDAVLLDPARPEFDLRSAPGWFGATPVGGISAVAGGRVPFTRTDMGAPLPFGPGKALWLKLRLQRAPGTSEAWEIEVPVPVLDSVTVYQQDASGRWFGRSAGDLVPIREWPLPGRTPAFRLQLRDQAPADVYVEVHHTTSLKLPVRLVTASAHHQRVQLEYLALGVLLGALALLVLSSLLRAVLLRDDLYAWYAVFALLAMGALAAFTGVATHLVWGDEPAWADAAPGCLALVGGSVAVLVVARLTILVTRRRWLGALLQFAGVVGVVFAGVYLGVDRNLGLLLLGLHLSAVAVLSLYAAACIWRRGDVVGLWLLLGAVPLAVCVALSVLRATGVLQPSWLSEYALVLALTIDLPLLFGALNSRSEERRSVELRRIASASQDPLTGLMKRGPFLARLHQAIARQQRRGESAAVAVIELANYEWIQKTRGAEAAEEALLRAVIKLRRLVRDVDTAGRIGEKQFGLILEGVGQREAVNRVGSRLVAAGLMEEPGRPRDAMLHLHVGAALLNEHALSAEQMLQSLSELLVAIGARTQRPFRLLEPGGASVPGPEPADAPAATTA